MMLAAYNVVRGGMLGSSWLEVATMGILLTVFISDLFSETRGRKIIGPTRKLVFRTASQSRGSLKSFLEGKFQYAFCLFDLDLHGHALRRAIRKL